MRGMFGGITVIVMIGGLINLGRFQIRYGVVVVVMVVVVTAVGMAVMSATVLEDEDSHQIHDKSHDCQRVRQMRSNQGLKGIAREP